MSLPLALPHVGDLLAPHDGPCLSLYVPTALRLPDKFADTLRLKTLLRTATLPLEGTLGHGVLEALREPIDALIANRAFWSSTHAGLAVLRSRDLFRVYRLPTPVPELAIVADSFHVRPLLRYLQGADRYEVLALTHETARLYEGNRDALHEVTLHPAVPRTLEEALGTEETEPTESGAGIGKMGPAMTGVSMHHTLSSQRQEVDKDTMRFFRAVDRAITRHHSMVSGVPLLLAALPEYHALFASVSHNPHLVKPMVAGNPAAWPIDELRRKAWTVMQPQMAARITSAVEQFGASRPAGRAAELLDDVAQAARGGRIRLLLIDDQRMVPGHIDPISGRAIEGSLDDPHTDDLLDDLAELTLRNGGEVLMVPSGEMPTHTGVAAVLRY